jgi:hypothetical protein
MYIPGHIGFTLGALNLTKERKYFNGKGIFFVAALALMPDILDHSIHLVLPSYPQHGIFHSLFLYAAALPVAFLFLKRLFLPLALMSFNEVLDIANTDLRALLYPIYGLTGPLRGTTIESPVVTFLNRWPGSIGYKLPTGHYVIFEAIGLAFILWVLTGKRTKDQKD